MKVVARGRNLAKSFGDVQAVKDASLEIRDGEAVAMLGPSGGGKTTLLHMLGLLEHPTSGSVHLDDVDAWVLPERDRVRLRLERIGVVYQERNLFGHLTAVENVLLPGWKSSGSNDAYEFTRDQRKIG